jgi:hypothetical protein
MTNDAAIIMDTVVVALARAQQVKVRFIVVCFSIFTVIFYGDFRESDSDWFRLVVVTRVKTVVLKFGIREFGSATCLRGVHGAVCVGVGSFFQNFGAPCQVTGNGEVFKNFRPIDTAFAGESLNTIIGYTAVEEKDIRVIMRTYIR